MRALLRFVTGLSLLLLIATHLFSAQQSQKDPAEGFLAGSYHSKSGETMRYRLFVPQDYDAAKKYPLVLWLHNAGARGSDNLLQITGSDYLGSHIWITSGNLEKYHAFVLAPQVSDTKGWSRPHANTPPVAIRLALEILDIVEKDYAIDLDSVYVAGESMGGEGVWRALSIDPSRFAAAIALCGYGETWQISRVAKVPVWVFQGEADPTVSVEHARQWVAELRKAGGSPKYSEYPGIGHDVWDVAFSEPGLVDWVFAHHRDAGSQP
jgi:predicted peptidase